MIEVNHQGIESNPVHLVAFLEENHQVEAIQELNMCLCLLAVELLQVIHRFAPSLDQHLLTEVQFGTVT